VRAVHLNVGHQTHPLPVPAALVARLLSHEPDVLILTEYVDAGDRRSLRKELARSGLGFQAVSLACRYAKGRWANQVFVASKEPLRPLTLPAGAPDVHAATNVFSVAVGSLSMVGLRAPAYRPAAEWYSYWTWLTNAVTADVVIGDFNADPSRGSARDRVLGRYAATRQLAVRTPSTGWSYKSTTGTTHRLDHLLHGSSVLCQRVEYDDRVVENGLSDHAILVGELVAVRVSGGPHIA